MCLSVTKLQSCHNRRSLFGLAVELYYILGGGIIGLTSAYELSKHFNVTLIEKEEVKRYR